MRQGCTLPSVALHLLSYSHIVPFTSILSPSISASIMTPTHLQHFTIKCLHTLSPHYPAKLNPPRLCYALADSDGPQLTQLLHDWRQRLYVQGAQLTWALNLPFSDIAPRSTSCHNCRHLGGSVGKNYLWAGSLFPVSHKYSHMGDCHHLFVKHSESSPCLRGITHLITRGSIFH